MKKYAFAVVSAVLASTLALPGLAKPTPDASLRVVIIRHGEKPNDGNNLSCQGENRALKLPAVLYGKFNTPDYTYVPSLEIGKATKHARMFQTVSPFAIAYNLKVNTQFDEKDTAGIAKEVLRKTGTVLLVWEHSVIPDIAKNLNVDNPPKWEGSDFDSIWVITYDDKGNATLTQDQEGLQPSETCGF